MRSGVRSRVAGIARGIVGSLSQLEQFVPPHNASTTQDLQEVESFLSKSERLFVLTGAGISTESGIIDYRSEGVGLYATSASRPTNYTDFLRSAATRQTALLGPQHHSLASLLVIQTQRLPCSIGHFGAPRAGALAGDPERGQSPPQGWLQEAD